MGTVGWRDVLNRSSNMIDCLEEEGGVEEEKERKREMNKKRK